MFEDLLRRPSTTNKFGIDEVLVSGGITGATVTETARFGIAAIQEAPARSVEVLRGGSTPKPRATPEQELVLP